MRVRKNLRAISILVWIILLLAAFIVGAFISYMWVMSNYYSMPENNTFLLIENAVFPIMNADYFNVTLLNPSNSVRDLNVTAFRVTVEGEDQELNVTVAEPQLPFMMTRGTRQIFKCKENWSTIAGKQVQIEPVAYNASVKSFTITPPNVRLTVTPSFDVSKSIEDFTLNIANAADSAINLTISDILLFKQSLKGNVTPPLGDGYNIFPGQMETFTVNKNWGYLRGENATITVRTAEGYQVEYKTERLRGAIIEIDDIKFFNTSSRFFNVTFRSSPDSTASAYMSQINITLHDGTVVRINTSIPLLNKGELSRVLKNSTMDFRCYWNWTGRPGENITVSAYTQQGFEIPEKWIVMPPAAVWKISDVKFDLDDTQHVSANVTNTPVSSQALNITTMLLNGTAAIPVQPFTLVDPGQSSVVNFTFDWSSFRGKNVNVTVVTQDQLKQVVLTKAPSIGLRILGESAVFGDLRDWHFNISIPMPIPYVNVTIASSNNSIINATVTRIVLQSGNKTYEIDGNITYPILSPRGYALKINETLTIVCPWNWIRYMGAELKVTVYTAEGVTASKTWSIFHT